MDERKKKEKDLSKKSFVSCCGRKNESNEINRKIKRFYRNSTCMYMKILLSWILYYAQMYFASRVIMDRENIFIILQYIFFSLCIVITTFRRITVSRGYTIVWRILFCDCIFLFSSSKHASIILEPEGIKKRKNTQL